MQQPPFPVMNQLTLCVPVHNRLSDIRRLLGSLENLGTLGKDFNVLVVDDGSADGTADFVRDAYPAVQLVALPENGGPAHARNVAIALCRTPYIAFFDSDAIPSKDWLARAVGHLVPDVIVAGKVLRPDGSVEWGPRRAAFWGGSRKTSKEKANAGSSCNMIVPVELAKKVGGFREDFFVYFEDTEFCIRARMTGLGRVSFADDLTVVHHHYSMNTPRRERLFWRNKIVGMMDLYPGTFRRLAFLAVSFLVLFQHLVRPRTFFASLSGYLAGLRKWLAGRGTSPPRYLRLD